MTRSIVGAAQERRGGVKRRSAGESFILVAALAGIAFAVGWSALGGSGGGKGGVFAGAAFGIILGAIAAPKMAEVQIVQTFPDQDDYIRRLDIALSELYVPRTSPDGAPLRVYESESEGSFSLPGVSIPGLTKRVRVRIDGNKATLVGPKGILSELGSLTTT
jgi:hypothetical protein